MRECFPDKQYRSEIIAVTDASPYRLVQRTVCLLRVPLIPRKNRAAAIIIIVIVVIVIIVIIVIIDVVVVAAAIVDAFGLRIVVGFFQLDRKILHVRKRNPDGDYSVK